MTDWGALYVDHVTALAALAGDLTAEQAAGVVPACPEWSVREVYAHLAGGAADGLAGRTDGAPGEAWTARHVAERAERTLGELVVELQANATPTATRLDLRSSAAVWDIATHHADLHEALGRSRLPDPLWQPIIETFAMRRVPDLVGTIDDYELFRGLFSRRSRAQLQALGLDEAAAESLGVFGPRDDDQPVAAPGVA